MKGKEKIKEFKIKNEIELNGRDIKVILELILEEKRRIVTGMRHDFDKCWEWSVLQELEAKLMNNYLGELNESLNENRGTGRPKISKDKIKMIPKLTVYMNKQEAAEVLGVHRNTITKYSNNNE